MDEHKKTAGAELHSSTLTQANNQEPHRRLEPGTGRSGWQSKDLCAACQSVNLDEISSNGTIDGIDVSLNISETSTCPLCLFPLSQWRRGDTPVESKDSTTTELSRYDINGIDHVCILHKDRIEYILQITDDELLEERGRITQYRHVDPAHADYPMIREWVAHCYSTHGKACQMLTERPLQIANLRLLDCVTETVAECIRFTEYVALSYVWGPSSNLAEKHTHVLSKAVIRDAIRVTLRLGFRYLWVDQLCIDQRNPDDMMRQLGQMNTIYNQASITIVAAAGESSLYGLPGVGQRSRTIPNKFTLNGTTWKYKPEPIKYRVGHSKWSVRGWTYQEAVFSRRCVIFADDQVFYQCGSMTCAEELIQDFTSCERIIFPIFERILCEDSDTGTYLPRSWRFMTNLKAYSKRELTYDSDVLRAMEGIFGFYAQLEPPVEQYWGLPLRWIGCQLSNLDNKNVYQVAKSKHNDVVGAILWAMLWEPAWSDIHIPKSGFPKRDGFPTWSWLESRSEMELLGRRRAS